MKLVEKYIKEVVGVEGFYITSSHFVLLDDETPHYQPDSEDYVEEDDR